MGFDFLTTVFEYFGSRHWFLFFEKKFEFELFKLNLQLVEILLKNELRSWNMVKPSLKSFRVDPGDAFHYRSSYQNTSRSKNRIRWKKFQNSFSLPISLRIPLRLFLEGNFQLKSTQKMIFFKKFISMSKSVKS